MDYNKLFLAGNLTRKPELSYTPNQTAVVQFGLAVNHKWKSRDGTQNDEVCFVDCVIFGNRAEAINKYLDKGNPLFVEGRLKLDQWEAQDGSKRSKLKVIVENFQFVPDGKQRNGQQGQQQEAEW